MLRQKAFNGQADVGGGIRDENANVERRRIRDAKESVHEPDEDGSLLRRFFFRTFVPLFLMTVTPNTVVVLWYTAVHCDGSFLRLFQVSAIQWFSNGVGRVDKVQGPPSAWAPAIHKSQFTTIYGVWASFARG